MLPVGGQSVSTLEPPYQSVEELLTVGLAASPEVTGAQAQWEAMLEIVPSRRALPNPALGYVHYLQSVETRVGPQQAAVSLSQLLPWFGKLRLDGRIAAGEADAAYYQYAGTVQKVAAEIEDAYWDYLYLHQAIGITRQNVELLRNWEAVALSKYITAQTSHPDIIKAQVEVLSLEDRLEALQQSEKPLLARLSAAMGKPITSGDIEIMAVPVFPLPPSIDSLLEEASLRNPGLLRSHEIIDVSESAVHRARLNYFPDLMLGGNVVLTGKSLVPDPPAESGRDALLFTVGITIPLYRKKYRALEQSAKAGLNSARLAAENIENQLKSQLELVSFDLHDAARKVRLYEEALIPRAEQSLLTSEKAYIAEEVDFLTLIESQRVLLNYQLSHQKALADLASHRARLHALLGRYPLNITTVEEKK
ncbi:MAG: TolC family protein [Fidelibacterota bacterium]|nr:MAG: TolC family protein [Candidatus Neomarinimicrobiota bacterium]